MDINVISETKIEAVEMAEVKTVYDKELLEQQERELTNRIIVLEAELSDVRNRLATFSSPDVVAAITVYVENKPVIGKDPVQPVVPNP